MNLFSTCEKSGDKVELRCENNICLLDPEIIETVSRNPAQFGWTATNYSDFWGRTLIDGVKFRCVKIFKNLNNCTNYHFNVWKCHQILIVTTSLAFSQNITITHKNVRRRVSMSQIKSQYFETTFK